jgi:hypothetical protein
MLINRKGDDRIKVWSHDYVLSASGRKRTWVPTDRERVAQLTCAAEELGCGGGVLRPAMSALVDNGLAASEKSVTKSRHHERCRLAARRGWLGEVFRTARVRPRWQALKQLFDQRTQGPRDGVACRAYGDPNNSNARTKIVWINDW